MSWWPWAWPSLQSDNLSWLSILILLIFQSFFAVHIPAQLKHLDARNHHREKLVNEFLAGYQFVYFGYYVGVLRDLKISDAQGWVVTILAGLILMSILFVFWAYTKARKQDKLIKRMHNNCPRNCTARLSKKDKWDIYGWTVVRAVISFSIALFIALHPALVKSTQ